MPSSPVLRLAAASASALAAAALALAPSLAAAAGGCPPGMRLVRGGTLALPGGATERLPSYCLDRTEVTAAAYASCVSLGACEGGERLDCGPAATYSNAAKASHPVNCVDWFEADAYCRAYGKRLPTEVEWEWAARGGRRGAAYPWGDAPPAAQACWDGDGNTAGKGERKGTCAVGANARGRSPDGLEDLAGNVREWTSTAEERFKVLRGGSWGDSLPEFLSASFRGFNAPDERMELLGFRCAAPLGAIVKRPTPKRVLARSPDEAGVLVIEPMTLRSGRARSR